MVDAAVKYFDGTDVDTYLLFGVKIFPFVVVGRCWLVYTFVGGCSGDEDFHLDAR